MSRDALVVGINKYERFNPLQAPGEDAEAVAQRLKQYGEFKVTRLPGVKDKQNNRIRVGQKTKVTLSQLRNAIIQLFKPKGKSVPDTALLYFSGHGLRQDLGVEEGFLASSDVNPEGENWGLPLQWLRRLLLTSEVRQQIVILDCCYSGEVLNFAEADPGEGGKARDRSFIAASREFEVAYEGIDGSHSAFTAALLEALEPKSERWVTNYTLVERLHQISSEFPQRWICSNSGEPIHLTRCLTPLIPKSETLQPELAASPHNLKRSGVIEFVGRADVLENLHQQLQQTERIAICAVAGMGGVGKTELALQYALHHQKQGTYPGGLCWILAGDGVVGTQIVSFARTQLDLQLPDGLELTEQVAYCWRHWRRGDVLFIFDDVRNYRQIKPYLPPAESRFKVLITTRRQKLGASFQRIHLDVLTEAAAIDLFVSLIGQERIEAEPEQVKHLCEQLGYLPLGLELVGRYLQRKPDLSFEKMCQRLGLKHRSLNNPDPDMTAQLGVEAAFELSWLELSQKAQKLGCFLSLFALAPILWADEDVEELEDIVEELEDIRDDELVNRSLLKRVDKESYQLHQLVREFLKEKLEELTEAEEFKHRFCQVMVMVAQQIPETPTKDDIVIATPMIPHLAEAATTQKDWLSDKDLIYPFGGLGRFYEGQGLYRQALPWRKQCLSATRERLGDDHLDVAMSLNNLAALYYSQGRYGEAEPLYQKALELDKRLLGDDHPDVARSLNNLARLYESQGRYSEAEPLYLQALELFKRLLGDDHPDVAMSFNNLALLYKSQGRYGEAEPLFLQALDLRKRLLGDDHPDVAQSLNNLAYLYSSQGRYGEAEPLYLQALELRKRLLGDDHPDVANSLNNLAALYRSQGRYGEAEPLYLQALKLYKRLLGDDHPDVAMSLNNLAGLYSSQGRYGEAEPLYQQALELCKRLLGDDHPNTITVRENLQRMREQWHQ
ncbi:MAG: tetratricopeptide repeat protein [Coleofasciculus sp. B1-GNL1-01]|uniref:tetratricopeptide repeat protein n=1 Tax=Coleofasciculus sp. B1-GNL1-01 TaxID=3068484 RepID=UPI0032F7CEA8